MKLLDLSYKAYTQYMEQVRGNENISFDQAQRKLSRNVLLVVETAPERVVRGLFSTKYKYGNLTIVVRNRKIVKVVNYKGKPVGWKINKQRYTELSKELGIVSSKY